MDKEHIAFDKQAASESFDKYVEKLRSFNHSWPEKTALTDEEKQLRIKDLERNPELWFRTYFGNYKQDNES